MLREGGGVEKQKNNRNMHDVICHKNIINIHFLCMLGLMAMCTE